MATIKYVPLEEELKRNPELRKEDIEALREWCEKQPHLPKMTDSELVIFLHSNYYLMEPTKSTIENYYTSRTHLPEFFSNRDPIGSKELREAMKIGIYAPMERTTKEGYRVFFLKLLDLEPTNFVYNDVQRLYNMIVDLFNISHGTSTGIVILIDTKGLSFGYAARFTPLGIQKYLYYLQEAFPVRLKGIHFMNAVPVVEIILSMVRPFLRQELVEILYVHSKKETLEKFVPMEILPNEVGGTAGPIAELRENCNKELEKHRSWFIEEEATRRVNESIRPGKGKTATDLFGAEGSFKKLDID
ncbi:alpha-tocopherol transfer protein-like isoform X2 [Belonocnema kinseyi]|uniref:alpha-tocopherol transfer protein-like isoform X2 n=1 Tax=Belonocnema kinseyi TaxID=2817044 RepID=UPI00143D9C66|nr:alpha-tocopherol transfer protein-like isoform X2 [Belonocnema kinseyi]